MGSKRILVVAATLLALAIGAASGCNLVLGIHDLSETTVGDSDAGPACDSDAQCDDSNPCTVDACPAGSCTHSIQPDGPAAPALQVAFDCRVLSCVKGQPVQQDDDEDFEPDAEDCTFDTCSGGMPFHTPKPDKTACTMGSDGVCEDGKCMIICTKDDQCQDNNPCSQDSCDLVANVCTFSPLNGVNTPGGSQIAGDCKVEVCVDGKSTMTFDDSDLPKTASDCDEELCSNGMPSNPPLSDTVTCGAQKDKFCDGAGTCIECNSPSQCPGIDTDCQIRSCNGHVCGLFYSPIGTPRADSFQKDGDCKVVVCDGTGSSAAQPANDANDVPSDGNACTKDVCTNGNPSHPFEPANTACGVNSACNATGQCGCANDMACETPNTCGGGGTVMVCGCTPKSCAALGKTCGTVPDGCFATQNCDNSTKDPTETDVDCGGGSTCGDKCAAGKKCNVDTDCGTGHCADGVCCNTACTGTCLACSTAKKGGGADGVCGSIATGFPDTSASMTCSGVTLCDGANNCKKVDGQMCGASAECLHGTCIDGVCCATACTGTCMSCSMAKTGGTDGVCANTQVNQPDTNGTVSCSGTSLCDGGGMCKKTTGQSCTVGNQCLNGNCIDGVCCGSASCGTCQSCNITGNAGTCTNITNGNQDTFPANSCTGSNVCDGNGTCKKVNGQSCAVNGNCVMGNCVDNICCNSACTATCKACNVMGSLGACTNIPSGMDDTSASMTCTGTSTCDGNGGCKKNDGQTCMASSECLNPNCIDGVCCNTTCTGTCKACNVAGSAGVCTNIPTGQTDTNAATTCVSPSACDGGGTCKKNDGQTCSAGGECVHGNCADGFCCNTSCQGTCTACDVTGSQGTCTNIPSGTPDNNAPTTCSGSSACDGMGGCKKVSGQTCLNGMQCLSGACASGTCQ